MGTGGEPSARAFLLPEWARGFCLPGLFRHRGGAPDAWGEGGTPGDNNLFYRVV